MLIRIVYFYLGVNIPVVTIVDYILFYSIMVQRTQSYKFLHLVFLVVLLATVFIYDYLSLQLTPAGPYNPIDRLHTRVVNRPVFWNY